MIRLIHAPFFRKNTVATYEAVRTIVEINIDSSHPYLWNDEDRSIDRDMAKFACLITDENSCLFTSAIQANIEQIRPGNKSTT